MQAIGRAGAGTNNIPVPAMTARGIAVFNAPGANANAVKELVIAGMLITARNIGQAWQLRPRAVRGRRRAINKAVEAGKKQFVGFELPGRTLGVIGLGAIGVQVANAARALGMKVVGYDPTITVQRAWQLASDVQPALSIDDLLSRSDFVTFHVPLTDETRHMINAERIKILKKGAVLLNFSREGILDDDAVVTALDQGHLYAYCLRLPEQPAEGPPAGGDPAAPGGLHRGGRGQLRRHGRRIRCATIWRTAPCTNSVNFPEIHLPRNGGYRMAIVNSNVPNMVGQISTDLAAAGLNILDMLNRSRGEVAVTLIDVDRALPGGDGRAIRAIEGVLSVRCLGD